MAVMARRKLDPAASPHGKPTRAAQRDGENQRRRLNSSLPGVNPALGAQTRKVLKQHYRAKHGVK